MRIGCHVSIRESIAKAPQRAFDLGCETMQIFSRPPQGGKGAQITPELVESFQIECKKYDIENIYVHCPYYINLASPDNRIRYGSAQAIKEEMERASAIRAKYVVTHIGSTRGSEKTDGIDTAIKMLRKALEKYDGETKLLLENSAGAGSIIGDDLKELGEIIKKANNSNIAGICLDTQHSFASGYDWNDFEKTVEKIEKEIGFNLVKLIHSNNSQSQCGSKVDRHDHINSGLIKIESFEKLVHLTEEKNIDMIIETKDEKVKEDIEILKSFRDK